MTSNVTIRADGKAEMAWAASGGRPWWGGGSPMNPNATIDEWLKAANMLWTIEESPVLYRDINGEIREMKDRKVLYRGDNMLGLGVASDDYKKVQPRDTVEYMFRQIERGGFHMETMGSLFDGRQFWALAGIDAAAHILDPKDKVRRHLLWATSADLSLANTWKFVDERVVCSNTLTFALGEGGRQVKHSHKKEVDFDQIDEKLGLVAKERFEQEVESLRKLAKTEISAPDFSRVVLELYSPNAHDLSESDLVKTLGRNRAIGNVLALARSDDLLGFDLKGVKGTAWGALNVVTQYIDHDGGNRTIDRRWQRAVLGSGAKKKATAQHILLDYADGKALPDCKLSNRVMHEILNG